MRLLIGFSHNQNNLVAIFLKQNAYSTGYAVEQQCCSPCRHYVDDNSCSCEVQRERNDDISEGTARRKGTFLSNYLMYSPNL